MLIFVYFMFVQCASCSCFILVFLNNTCLNKMQIFIRFYDDLADCVSGVPVCVLELNCFVLHSVIDMYAHGRMVIMMIAN